MLSSVGLLCVFCRRERSVPRHRVPSSCAIASAALCIVHYKDCLQPGNAFSEGISERCSQHCFHFVQ